MNPPLAPPQIAQVDVWRGGRAFTQSFSRGAATAPMSERAAAAGEPASGTRVEFVFDRTVFAAGVAFDQETIVARLRELAFLNRAATLRLRFGSGPKAAASGGGAAAKAPAQRRRSSAAADEDGGNGGSSSSGVAGGGGIVMGAVDAEGWQVFHFEGGLQEYVQW